MGANPCHPGSNEISRVRVNESQPLYFATWPKGRALWRLLQKKLGFRTLFDVVPLDTSLVRGSHGLAAGDVRDRPLLIGDGAAPDEAELAMTAVHDLVVRRLTVD